MALTTAILVGAGAGLTLGGVQAFGQRREAKSQREQYRMATTAARMRGMAAKEAAAYKAEQIRRQKYQMLGRQRALFAKAGVRPEGTPLEVIGATAAEYEYDIAATLEMGERAAQMYEYQAAMYGRARRAAGRYGPQMATTLLTRGISGAAMGFGVGSALGLGAAAAPAVGAAGFQPVTTMGTAGPMSTLPAML